VTDAVIELAADMIKAVPDFGDEAGNADDQRLRCFLFFRYHEDPAKLYHPRCYGWCTTNLREKCYDIDKEYSRSVSGRAIPRLIRDINVLRDPQHAWERFSRILALGSTSSGEPENGDKTC